MERCLWQAILGFGPLGSKGGCSPFTFFLNQGFGSDLNGSIATVTIILFEHACRVLTGKAIVGG